MIMIGLRSLFLFHVINIPPISTFVNKKNIFFTIFFIHLTLYAPS
jgi:hypothetical protein